MDPYCYNPNQYNNHHQYGAAPPPPPTYNLHGHPTPVNHHAPMPYCLPAHGGHHGHATHGSAFPGAGLLGQVFGQSHGHHGNGHGRRMKMKKNKGYGCGDSSGSDSD